jgi:Clr5 domain
MALPGPSAPYSSLSLSDVPFNQKWELLKPHIHRLYITENRPLSEVISTMKKEFNFNAKLANLSLAPHREANQPSCI